MSQTENDNEMKDLIRQIFARQRLYNEEWAVASDDTSIADEIGLDQDTKAKIKFRQQANGMSYLAKHLPTTLLEKFRHPNPNQFKSAVETWTKLLDEKVPPVDKEILDLSGE